MSAGMAEIIAAHQGYETLTCIGGYTVDCLGCDWRTFSASRPNGDDIHAAHVAEELAKAGYGDVQEAKAEGLAEAAAIIHARIRDREQPFTIAVDGMSVPSGEGAMWAIPDLQLVERVIRARLDGLVEREVGS